MMATIFETYPSNLSSAEATSAQEIRRTWAHTHLDDSDSLLDLYRPDHDESQRYLGEPLRGILRHNREEDAPSELGSGEGEGSIRSVSSVGQSPVGAQVGNVEQHRILQFPSGDLSHMDYTSQQTNFSRPKKAKPGVSKIPVMKSSPLAKSSPQSAESSYVLNRKGSIKNARNSLETLNLKANRLSSASLDASDPPDRQTPSEALTPTTPTPPTVPRLPNLAPQNSTKRRSLPDPKSSHRTGDRIASGQGKQRAVSAGVPGGQAERIRSNSTPKRPINRPEGDPPWIATMFKPDPRLPQDQQMLPTHAKRLAMEQGTFIPPTENAEGDMWLQVPASEQRDTTLVPKRSTSFKNLLRRVSLRSKKSQEAFTTTEQPPEQAMDQARSGDAHAQWPLRGSSFSKSMERNVPEPFTPPVPASLSATDESLSYPAEYEPGHTSTRNIPPLSANLPPSTKYPESSAPSATMIKPRDIPQTLVKEDKASSCACCLIM